MRPLPGAELLPAEDPIAVPPLTSNFDKGVIVPIPTLPDEFQTPEPGNQAAFETVRYVVEALVIVPLVTHKLVKVPFVVVAAPRFAVVVRLPVMALVAPSVILVLPPLSFIVLPLI